jgi:hypothetical protein
MLERIRVSQEWFARGSVHDDEVEAQPRAVGDGVDQGDGDILGAREREPEPRRDPELVARCVPPRPLDDPGRLRRLRRRRGRLEEAHRHEVSRISRRA